MCTATKKKTNSDAPLQEPLLAGPLIGKNNTIPAGNLVDIQVSGHGKTDQKETNSNLSVDVEDVN